MTNLPKGSSSRGTSNFVHVFPQESGETTNCSRIAKLAERSGSPCSNSNRSERIWIVQCSDEGINVSFAMEAANSLEGEFGRSVHAHDLVAPPYRLQTRRACCRGSCPNYGWADS